MIALMKNAFLNEFATKKALANFILEADKFSMGEECNKFEQKFLNFDFMNTNIDKDDFYNILLAREKIYKNWYPGFSQKENEKMLISQAAEYAAMGYFISHRYTNPIVIGSDHHVMSPFYRASSNKLVVLYIQKNYTT